MMLEPKIILLDEPTEGLMPRMVSQIHQIIDVLHRDGVAILLVEQNVPLTLEASDRVYIMEKGVVRHHALAADLQANHAVITSIWESERSGPSGRADPHPDNQRSRQRHDPGAGRLGADAHLRDHGRGELRPRRARDARAFVGATTIGMTGNFWLALMVATLAIAAFGAILQVTTLAASRPRPAHDILATFGISLVLQKYALWQWGPRRESCRSHHGAILALLPEIPLVPDCHRRPRRGHHWCALPFSQVRKVRHLDPRRHAGSRHGPGHGHPGPAGSHRRFRNRSGHGGGKRRALRSLAGVTQNIGADFTLRAFIVVVVGGMGNLGGSILAAIFISLLEAYASLIVSPAQAVIVSFVALILTLLFRPTGLFVPTQ